MEAVIFLNTKCTDKTYAQLVAVLNTLIKVNILPNYSFQDNCILQLKILVILHIFMISQ